MKKKENNDSNEKKMKRKNWNNGKRYILAPVVIIAACAMFYFGANSVKNNIVNVTEAAPSAFEVKSAVPAKTDARTVRAADKFAPADYISGSRLKVSKEKDYTIMIYMNGSDLESEYAAGTDDIIEMATSGFDEANVNVIIFTGGCKKWHIDGIPDNVNTIFSLSNKKLTRLAPAGAESTGDPKTLAGFIDFCQTLFPAKNYGLILWNHGGGAVIGYGADERYEDNPEQAMMKLSDIDNALSVTSGRGKLQFLGFDTCLMSTLEMANIAQKYASYLIASEEVEPEQGWDYSFLGKIRPSDGGYEIGKQIIDAYKNYYARLDLKDFITLSMTDLSKTAALVDSFEKFAAAAGNALEAGGYNHVSRARSRTRTFGSGGEDGDTDMVDVKEMSSRMSYLFPNETLALQKRLSEAVCYMYESAKENTGGLSVYFPFYNKENLEFNIQTYRSMNQLPNYTKFISGFSAILNGRPAHDFYRDANVAALRKSDENPAINAKPFALTAEQRENLSDVRSTVWMKAEGKINGKDDYYIQLVDNTDVVVGNDGTLQYKNAVRTLNGYVACLYDTNNGAIKRYAIPVVLNGRDANLIVIFNDDNPDGTILGAVPTTNDAFNTVDKKLISIKDGDKLALRYYALAFPGSEDGVDVHAAESWHVGNEFTVKGGLKLEETDYYDKSFIEKIKLVDTQNNSYYIDVDK